MFDPERIMMQTFGTIFRKIYSNLDFIVGGILDNQDC